MSSIEIRHLALDYAARTAQSGEPLSFIVNAAKAFEAYLTGTETDGGAHDSVGDEAALRSASPTEAPSSPGRLHTPAEPPVGSVAVLRSPTSGALITAVRKAYSGEDPAWYEFDDLKSRSWAVLIDGREIVAVHTPDVAS